MQIDPTYKDEDCTSRARDDRFARHFTHSHGFQARFEIAGSIFWFA